MRAAHRLRQRSRQLGIPIIVDGKQLGSIGISGGSSEQDNQIATVASQAGLRP